MEGYAEIFVLDHPSESAVLFLICCDLPSSNNLSNWIPFNSWLFLVLALDWSSLSELLTKFIWDNRFGRPSPHASLANCWWSPQIICGHLIKLELFDLPRVDFERPFEDSLFASAVNLCFFSISIFLCALVFLCLFHLFSWSFFNLLNLWHCSSFSPNLENFLFLICSGWIKMIKFESRVLTEIKISFSRYLEYLTFLLSIFLLLKSLYNLSCTGIVERSTKLV
jgi:hypothetical protein